MELTSSPELSESSQYRASTRQSHLPGLLSSEVTLKVLNKVLIYGDQTQLLTVMLVPQYTTHAAVLGGLDPVG